MISTVKILCIFFIGFFLNPSSGIAQKQNNSWVFGIAAGIDFNTQPVQPILKKAISSAFPNYTTAISNNQGDLQFFSDGKKVWDKNSRRMNKPRTTYWWEDANYTCPLICPKPGSNEFYYLFIAADFPGNSKRLFYVGVDMSLNNGNGGLLYDPDGNNPDENYREILSNSSVMLAGTQHCNKSDYWIITHKENKLLSYLVTAAGVSINPVITSFPTALISASIIPSKDQPALNMKFSASGEKLILPVAADGKIIVLDFDTKTGIFSNPLPLAIDPDKQLFDTELSPNGSKLYYDTKYFSPVGEDFIAELDMIYQVDLSAGPDPQKIANTKTALLPFPDRSSYPVRGPPNIVIRTMQLAPDGKIYLSKRSRDKSVNLIEDPDRAGADCRYIRNGFPLLTPYENINFNCIRSLSFVNKQNSIQVQKGACDMQPVQFSLIFNKPDSVVWNFGDIPSGANNSSKENFPQHIFTKGGDYIITAVIYQSCFTDTASTTVTVKQDIPLNPPFQPVDSAVCESAILFADVSTPNATNYIWSTGSNDPQIRITDAGDYTVTIRNQCHIKSYDFTISYIKCPCEIYVPNAFTPNTDGLNDYFKPAVKCALSHYRLEIYNRYGKKVFQTNDYKDAWDGRMKGEEQPLGNYTWMIKYYDPDRKSNLLKKGSLVLTR